MQQKYVPPPLAASRHALDWNGPLRRAFAPVPDEDLECSIARLFECAADRHPDRIALDDGQVRMTYTETVGAVRSLASRIQRETKAGDLVGILLPTSAEFTVAMLACLRAGRLFVPLDLHYPSAWIADVVDDAAMAAVIARFDGEAAQLVPSEIVRIDLARSGGMETAQDECAAETGPDAPAFVLYTSGSTGRPKGIVNSQRNLLRRIQQYVNAAHISAEDKFLPLSSECTIAGLRERFAALLTGSALHLVDVQRGGARQILTTLDNAAISIVYGVPALLRSLATLESDARPKALRVLRIGGDAVLWNDIELLRGWLPHDCLIELGYSSTEAPIMQWFVPRNRLAEGPRVPIGYPLAGNNLAIVGEDGLPSARGEVGELVVRSPYVALGRWVGGRCISDDFPNDPSAPGARILRTGDLGREREDGLIELVGRKDRQVKIRGVRIEPAEIEAQLRLCPDVADAAIFPRRSGDDIRLIAYVTPRSNGQGNLQDALKTFLRERLSRQLQPARIYSVSAIPRLPSAKLDMAALAAMDGEIAAAEKPEAVTEARLKSEQERKLETIWCRLLNRDAVDREADFFDLGGDSLTTLSLMFEIEEEFGVQLPVTMIFEAPTIANLAAVIEKHREYEFSPLVRIQAGRGGIPFFICHGVGGNVMELFPLGRRIVSDGDVYAIQAKGLDGREEPNRHIGDMADYYLDAIRKVQARGPYLLAGYSSGGLVAYEMARKLKTVGEVVGLLVLLDTQTNARQWPLAEWLRVFARRARHHLKELGGLTGADKVGYATTALSAFARRIFWRLGISDADRPITSSNVEIPGALRQVYAASLEAVSHFRPTHYDGDALLFLATTRDPLMAEPERIWPAHVARLDARFVSGDHRTMIYADIGASLAAQISEAIANVSCARAEP